MPGPVADDGKKPVVAEPTPTAVTPAKNGKAFEPRVVDLLKLVDPKLDAAKSSWRLKGHDLLASKDNGSQLSVQYRPPLEYDLNVNLSKDDNGCGTLIMFPHDRKELFLSLQGATGDGTHFGKLPGSLLSKANTSFKLQRNKTHAVRIEVRSDRLKAYIDDKLWLNYATDYSEFLGKNEDKGLITLIDWYSNIRYSKLEVIERSATRYLFSAWRGKRRRRSPATRSNRLTVNPSPERRVCNCNHEPCRFAGRFDLLIPQVIHINRRSCGIGGAG